MKIIEVDCCGNCPFNDGDTATKTWYCMHAKVIDTYGVPRLLGNNTLNTLNNIPDWCPLEDKIKS
jgi:hypothetical protein